MDPTATLSAIEDLYRQVLEQTREQESCLRAGNVASLPAILEHKTAALSRAQELTTAVLGSGNNQPIPGFQEALNRIGAILAQTVSAEDRCQALIPKPTQAVDRRRAVAAYGGSAR